MIGHVLFFFSISAARFNKGLARCIWKCHAITPDACRHFDDV